MKVATTCPVTGAALYVSDIKPGLIENGARGDWGYDPKAERAANLNAWQARAAMSDMKACGRMPKLIA